MGHEDDELSAILVVLQREAEWPRLGTELSVTEVLGEHLESIVRSHNTPSVIFHFSQGDMAYVLKVEFGHAPTMTREIQWYRDAIRIGRPSGLYVGSHIGTSFSFMILRRFGDGSTVDDAALAGASAHELESHVASALRRDTSMLERTRTTVALAHVHGLAADRFHRRRAQSMSYPYLRSLLGSPFVEVNGERFRTPDWSWKQIADKQSVVEYLTPQEIGMTFGDLHCGNILVSGSATEVVDPRGGSLLPITYDYGKLVQSIDGGYGAIMAGRYALRELRDGQYEFSVETPPGYKQLATSFSDHFDERQYMQSLYQAALHFTAMLPHHASEPAETTALYLSGILLFNKLITRLR
jgi:hypothetical protein